MANWQIITWHIQPVQNGRIDRRTDVIGAGGIGLRFSGRDGDDLKFRQGDVGAGDRRQQKRQQRQPRQTGVQPARSPPLDAVKHAANAPHAGHQQRRTEQRQQRHQASPDPCDDPTVFTQKQRAVKGFHRVIKPTATRDRPDHRAA